MYGTIATLIGGFVFNIAILKPMNEVDNTDQPKIQEEITDPEVKKPYKFNEQTKQKLLFPSIYMESPVKLIKFLIFVKKEKYT